jgi:hypothetical protein
VLIPREPQRFLDQDTFSAEELIELVRKEAEELDQDSFCPWILEHDGQRRVPAFSSQKKAVKFSGEISRRLNQVFALGTAEVLLTEIVGDLQVDFVDLNPLTGRSWELRIGLVKAND